MKRAIKNFLIALSVPVIVYLIFLIPNFERFGTLDCLYSIFIQSLIPSIIGFGVSFVWLSGITDFSLGSRVVVSGMVGGILAGQFGIAGLIIGGILVCLLTGVINAFVVNLLRIPTMISTLGLTMLYEIFAYYLGRKFNFSVLDKQYRALGEQWLMIVLFVVAAIVFYFVYNRTKISYHIRATGTSPTLAKLMGINVDYAKAMGFVIGSAFLGVAAVMQLSYTGGVTVQTGLASAAGLFKPLMGVLIGLTLSAWCNLSVGVFFGSFIINTMFFGLVALGLPDAFQSIALGVFIVAVMYITMSQERIAHFFKKKSKKQRTVEDNAN